VRTSGREQEERFHDLRVARRLGYARDRVIRELIERRRSDLERVGVLLFVPEAPYGTALSNETRNSLAPGCWLNFKQATLVGSVVALGNGDTDDFTLWRKRGEVLVFFTNLSRSRSRLDHGQNAFCRGWLQRNGAFYDLSTAFDYKRRGPANDACFVKSGTTAELAFQSNGDDGQVAASATV
jgi:hypothetical protein